MFVEQPNWGTASPEAKRALQDRALARAASEHNAGTIVIGHPPSSRLKDLLFGSVAHDVLRNCPGADLRVVPL